MLSFFHMRVEARERSITHDVKVAEKHDRILSSTCTSKKAFKRPQRRKLLHL